ncbi:MAG: hypothetical protein Q9162_003074 [Coniocarpon cinnabarinum]
MLRPGSPDFESGIHHWYGSSTQLPACVFEPGTPQDVSTALGIIAENETPFCIKSGGHASNAGFSSTTGVHMSMIRMNQTTLSPDNSTVEIGMGLGWSQVYKSLEPTGYNVVGGRVAGPGVGGFTLGGGFSWKSNQFGLTSDTVKSFKVVLPNGTIASIDSETSPDEYFALKGGLNRFGIVTSAVYYTHPQPPQVFAGIRVYPARDTQALLQATADFNNNNKDPKAQIIHTLNGGLLGTTSLVLFFYDGPTAPSSFAPFDAIKPSIDLVKPQSFAISFDIEPFLPSYGQHATESAYPHSGSPLPLNLYFSWTDAAQDEWWYDAMRESVALLKNVAKQEGIAGDYTAYPNYAIANTSAEDLYGTQNAQRLRTIKQAVDPTNIMGLTGGFDLGAN